MADNDIVSNSQASSNPDIPVRTIDKSGQKTQVVTLDLGGAGAEILPSGSIPISGSVSVSNFPATQPVSGTVDVGNFPATQDVNITNTSLPLPEGAATSANQDTSNSWLDDLYSILRAIRVAIMYPSYVDRSLLRARVTGIIESGTVTTLTTCATVTNLAQLATYQAQLPVLDLSRNSWAANVRARYT